MTVEARSVNSRKEKKMEVSLNEKLSTGAQIDENMYLVYDTRNDVEYAGNGNIVDQLINRNTSTLRY